ncbi:Crp/Fnr family transcriptional regulator [Arenibacter sp. M-2]|uniref:Crp/Fnr family transcriptional regulator n=1 Tax=unclassified Arenibacter TaxID=2615047 RepID=UPI000D76CDC6|nr:MULTISPECIES: Crp/Fnr family transcriptional regulator [unclassified Arenibacter]MDL5513543.1 Crp/Fnr family transcriptional regulator [Arenibacter sp. M-2]PXX27361.1 CRP-like cAMP-binding protein [Arenibacter sp. ARW7G5Y1]
MLFIDFYNTVLNTSFTYDELPFPITTIQVPKGRCLTDYGQVEDSLYFMNKGIVEMKIKSYMTEKIVDFFFESELFCGYTSFLDQLPTDVQITTLVDSEIEVIKRKDLIPAYEHSFEANKFGRICTEQGYIRKSNREKELLTKTAEERYNELFRSRAQYIAHIPVNKIAKYLGIHPESLSRIRNKINS